VGPWWSHQQCRCVPVRLLLLGVMRALHWTSVIVLWKLSSPSLVVSSNLVCHLHPCHTHTRLTALFRDHPGELVLKQETVSGSGISCAICKSAPRSRQITMPAPHHSVFLQAGCPSCRPTNSVKALRSVCVPQCRCGRGYCSQTCLSEQSENH